MRQIPINLANFYESEVFAGYIRENEHIELVISLPIDLIGEGYMYRLSMQSFEGDDYLTDLISAADGLIGFVLSSSLTAFPYLKLQVLAIRNEIEIGKSKVVTLYFDVSLPEDGIQPPAPGNPPVPRGLPPGGTDGQMLTKASDSDYDTEWVDPQGGSDYIIVAGNYSLLPSTASEAQIAFARNPINYNIPYKSIPRQTTVDTIKPVQNPTFPDPFVQTSFWIIADQSGTGNRVQAKLTSLLLESETVNIMQYNVVSDNVTYQYVYAGSSVDGIISQGWNSVEGSTYTPITYAEIEDIKNVLISGPIPTINNTLAGNVMFEKQFPKGYYTFNNTLSKWEYGFIGNPTTQAEDFPVKGIVDGDGENLLDNKGIYHVISYLQTLFIGSTQYGGPNAPFVYIPDNIFNNLYQQSTEILTASDPLDPTKRVGTIALASDVTIYTSLLSLDATTYSFTIDETEVSSNDVLTFELILTMSAAATVEFTGITWLNGETPNIEDTGFVYAFAFRKIGGQWIGNLQGRWAMA